MSYRVFAVRPEVFVAEGLDKGTVPVGALGTTPQEGDYIVVDPSRTVKPQPVSAARVNSWKTGNAPQVHGTHPAGSITVTLRPGVYALVCQDTPAVAGKPAVNHPAVTHTVNHPAVTQTEYTTYCHAILHTSPRGIVAVGMNANVVGQYEAGVWTQTFTYGWGPTFSTRAFPAGEIHGYNDNVASAKGTSTVSQAEADSVALFFSLIKMNEPMGTNQPSFGAAFPGIANPTAANITWGGTWKCSKTATGANYPAGCKITFERWVITHGDPHTTVITPATTETIIDKPAWTEPAVAPVPAKPAYPSQYYTVNGEPTSFTVPGSSVSQVETYTVVVEQTATYVFTVPTPTTIYSLLEQVHEPRMIYAVGAGGALTKVDSIHLTGTPELTNDYFDDSEYDNNAVVGTALRDGVRIFDGATWKFTAYHGGIYNGTDWYRA